MTNMTKGIRIHQYGNTDILVFEDIPLIRPAANEVLLKHTAIGINYIDTYHRSGLYTVPAFPAILGMEAAGIIEETGNTVREFKKGDRVAYASPPIGAYSEARLMLADRIVKIPDDISDQQAAAILLKGMTAHYLIHRTYKVKEGDTVLWHAAAGGVGLIACRWLKHLGATIIGTVGSEEKAVLAKAHGCDHIIYYRQDDIVKTVKEITKGKGVDVVYDSVGKDTFTKSLDCLKPLGMMVSFGNASGAVPAFEPALLSQKGSLFFTRPTLMHYTAQREDLVSTANAVFDATRKDIIKVNINQTYPLEDAAQAHRDLESRKTTGSSLLIP